MLIKFVRSDVSDCIKLLFKFFDYSVFPFFPFNLKSVKVMLIRRKYNNILTYKTSIADTNRTSKFIAFYLCRCPWFVFILKQDKQIYGTMRTVLGITPVLKYDIIKQITVIHKPICNIHKTRVTGKFLLYGISSPRRILL